MTEFVPPNTVAGLSPSTVSVLTPPGSGAIACIEVRGTRAWDAVRKYFLPVGKKALPEATVPNRFWFGTLGETDGPGDETILSVKELAPNPRLEIHCHGGRRVVRWIVGLFLMEGFGEVPALPDGELSPLQLLTHAATERTASILLDQQHGAFRQQVEAILQTLDTTSPLLQRLVALASVGRHLVEPWRVVIAGPPNVGKSSLMNALAGYARSIVAPVAGTTRDVVTVAVAFDGWPFELSDTAGLHDSADALEAEGIAKAGEELAQADLIVWVIDASVDVPVPPPVAIPAKRLLAVWNKSDLAESKTPPPGPLPEAERGSFVFNPLRFGEGGSRSEPGGVRQLNLSSLTGAGVPELIAAIVARLVPSKPEPLEGVPYTPALAGKVEAAWSFFNSGNVDAARISLASCLAVRSQ